MITPKECGHLSQKTVKDFINTCDCKDMNDIRRVLINLISTASQAMVATNGLDTTLKVLSDTSRYLQITKPEYKQVQTGAGIRILPVRNTRH
ncbi:hypothetical protein HX52_01085 [Salmonella enterica]|uniref:hypothetical protein n=1 Tax=Salmonella sp. SG203 TaxID=2555397 RepID=UPI001275F005|nr:hypothetical protein [Salmonella sp. SG203]EAW8180869.1 hypothetical protein [Salmonella enterica]EDU6130277.1 hypothetical protein [Salmonella enterica subsp. enterica]EII2806835.1 hypothetical protein [Salmonella enterica subsp. enterica serovar Java]EBL7696595.1 hypothetical protein [Salmonella enterica]EGF4127749.1 hypothetical protein [Salmonella enterica]